MSNVVYITRTSSFLPLAAVDNDSMESVLGMTGPKPSRTRKITLRSNGIKLRHYAIDPKTGEVRYTNAQLTAEAVRGLTDDNFKLNDIACLSTGTSIADQLMPNHGVMVHGELGNPACEVISTTGICAAGATALKYAWLAVRSGEFPNAVATGSDTGSIVLKSTRYAAETEQQVAELEARPELAFEKDFLRWMLSDAAGAMLLQDRPNSSGLSLRIDWIDITSYANEMPVCMYAGAVKNDDGTLTGWARYTHEELGRQSVLAVKQDVKILNANVVEYCLTKPLAKIAKKRGLRAKDIDWFVPHMSSEFFRQPMAEGLEKLGLGIPQERWFTNLATRGNSGAASFFVMLDDLVRSGRLQPGQRILGFVPESGRFSSAYLHLTVV
ncbi:MAG: beta-ketoacyl-ACP synthase III [Verrucomicrobia bacterium]|nr:beta-ketoacyl-ACP synthase III [Verrucomicrobiota bacterium]